MGSTLWRLMSSLNYFRSFTFTLAHTLHSSTPTTYRCQAGRRKMEDESRTDRRRRLLAFLSVRVLLLISRTSSNFKQRVSVFWGFFGRSARTFMQPRSLLSLHTRKPASIHRRAEHLLLVLGCGRTRSRPFLFFFSQKCHSGLKSIRQVASTPS